MPRGGARETHKRDHFFAARPLTTDAVGGGATPCWCVASCASQRLHSGCETVDVRACCATCLVCPSTVVCIPSTQWSEAQVLCACVCPNHSNNSTGLQHRQQRRCSFGSVVSSPGVAAGQPCSCCCCGQDVSSSSSNISRAVVVLLSVIVVYFWFIILTIKWSLHFRTH